MSYLETAQKQWKILKTLGADDTALVWSGASQTVDQHEERGTTIESVDIMQNENAAVVAMHGTDAANETLAWMLIGWAEGGPAEYIAHGTATLGTQRVDKATSTELWAGTIAITAQKWLKPVYVRDSGNNRIAKLAFDLCGLAKLACVIQKTTTATTGAKVRFF